MCFYGSSGLTSLNLDSWPAFFILKERMASRIPTIVVSVALLLVPIAIWVEQAYPHFWQARLLTSFSEPEPTVVCVDDTLILGTSKTGYSVLELSDSSSPCRR